jgi:hypothetical protein
VYDAISCWPSPSLKRTCSYSHIIIFLQCSWEGFIIVGESTDYYRDYIRRHNSSKRVGFLQIDLRLRGEWNHHLWIYEGLWLRQIFNKKISINAASRKDEKTILKNKKKIREPIIRRLHHPQGYISESKRWNIKIILPKSRVAQKVKRRKNLSCR